MKKLALPIIAFSVLGIASLFIPMSGHSMFNVFLEFDRFRLVLLGAGFAAPIVAAVMAMRATRPQSWHGYAALAGYAVVFVKSELWSLISNITNLPTAMLVLTLATLGGILCSLVGVATEERPS